MNMVFPSPRGDVVSPESATAEEIKAVSFRPLAGMW